MRKNILILLVLLLITITSNSQTLKDEWVVCNSQGCKIHDPYYSDGVTLKWEGSCINGKADGYGKLTKLKNGKYESTYEGEYKNGIREGKGKFTHVKGTIQEGIFIKGQMTGLGSQTFSNGDIYNGEFINYCMHGNGVYTFANGAKFDGFICNNNMYTGKYTNNDGKESYYEKGAKVESIKGEVSNYKPKIGTRVIEYFDNNWKRCNQNDASFYRLITYEAPNIPIGIIKDYYLNGKIQSEYYAVYLDYDDDAKTFYENEATWYYQNGNIQQKRFYYNNKIHGKNTFYYDNGVKSEEVNYDHGVLNGEYKQWYKTGKLKLLAIYNNGKLLNDKCTEFDENGLGALVYNENFNANKEAWTSNESSSESMVNKENQVELILKENETEARGNYISFNQNSNYSLESIVQMKSGDDMYGGFGLIFGFMDWGNYFYFTISTYGVYSIGGFFEGVKIDICDLVYSEFINKGFERNLIKVLKYDEKFIFSINSRIVKTVDSKILRGNYFGIIAASKGSYTLENITIREFVNNTEINSDITPKNKNDNQDWKGNGSGFFISEKGYIATNNHVIDGANDIQIEFFQNGIKQIYKAKVIISDKQNDLSILRVDDLNFKTLPTIPYVFSTSTKDVGSEVFALGYPIANVMGEEIKFTDGKISSKTGIEGDVRVYQITTPIQPGNSGGPLFDSNGNLVGITSSALNKEKFNSENVNYAIKCSYLKNLIEVVPETINLPNNKEIYGKSLTEKIKILSEFIPIIKVR